MVAADSFRHSAATAHTKAASRSGLSHNDPGKAPAVATITLKDLRKVKRCGYPLERILAIDDSPEKLQRQYGNHIPVMPFVGDPADRELENLLPFLDWIRAVENVRTVEKRKWRSFGRTHPM